MKYPFDNTFAGKSIFVTGHTGFKGSWLCLWLHKLGATITGYALEPPTNPSNFVDSNVRALLADHHEADIRDVTTIKRALHAAQPDLVLHLAAQSVVRKGYVTPHETFDVNVMGTCSVLEAVRTLDKPCAVVAVTSDKCYDNREQVWGYRECDPFGDHDPYGGSKGAAEIAIRTYRDSFFPPEKLESHGIKLASARAGNVIGGGDWTEDALIVDLVRNLSKNQPVPIRSPGAFRPWQHVLQALSGYLTLAAELLHNDSPEFCSGWNIGPLPGNELPVLEVVKLFLAEWGSGSWIDVSDTENPHEANTLRLNVDKAIWKLRWKPCWDVQQTLYHAASWYRDYFAEGSNPRQLCLNHIGLYEEAMKKAAGHPVNLQTEETTRAQIAPLKTSSKTTTALSERASQ